MIPPKLLQPFSLQLDEELLYNLAEVGTLKAFKKDDIIIDVGQSMKNMPLLIKGNIKVLREDKNGDELLLYVLESGDTCAMSLTCGMSHKKSKIRAVADNDVEVVLVPFEISHNWFNTNDSWRYFVLQNYQIRFDEMLDTIDTLAFMKMDERIYKYLKEASKLSASSTIEITHQSIAEDLHTSRVVISRLLKQLENKSKIKLGRNKIEVLSVF